MPGLRRQAMYCNSSSTFHCGFCSCAAYILEAWVFEKEEAEVSAHCVNITQNCLYGVALQMLLDFESFAGSLSFSKFSAKDVVAQMLPLLFLARMLYSGRNTQVDGSVVYCCQGIWYGQARQERNFESEDFTFVVVIAEPLLSLSPFQIRRRPCVLPNCEKMSQMIPGSLLDID